MKKLHWFTNTNITNYNNVAHSYLLKGQKPNVSYDLTEFVRIFIENEIWNKKKYRSEYKTNFVKEDVEKILSIKIDLHTNGPFSNTHDYEKVLNNYIELSKYENRKISSSGIGEAKNIAVIEVEFYSESMVMNYLNYDEEKDIDIIYEKQFSKENYDAWLELNKIKSIVSEFIQFFNFNLHLNFLTHDYAFSFEDKPNLIGFTTVSEENKFYYETDKIDFLSHYILYEPEKDNLLNIMEQTAKFWHRDISSIHFFLDALKGNHITATNFIKLVFTIESFFAKNISNDYITLTIPLISCKDINSMKSFRESLKKAFALRNEIVHGNEIFEIHKCAKLFFELKNIISLIFHFYIKEGLYNGRQIEKINHELIFKYFPKGIS